MSDAVLVDVSDHIMTITINRPEAKNALNGECARTIAGAIDRLEADDDIRVAILTGAGGSFCTGMDLKGFLTGDVPVFEDRGFGGFVQALPKKPIIAAVEGYAVAGGCEMVLGCDLVIAADDAKFGLPEVKRGLVAAAGGLTRLPKQIPQRLAMEYALTGEFFTAQRAAEIGLINKTVPAGTALEAAKELAVKICSNGPLAVAASKQIVKESANWSPEEEFTKTSAMAKVAMHSEDAKEGARAFAEKRAPVWQGK